MKKSARDRPATPKWCGSCSIRRVTSYDAMLKQFWEGHDPTQGMRQGADVGTQYRSAIYYYGDEQRRAAERSRDEYQRRLTAAGFGTITHRDRAGP